MSAVEAAQKKIQMRGMTEIFPSCRFYRCMMKLEGYVEHIIYRNVDNGYSVLNLAADEEEITVVGIFSYISEGELLELEGEYTEHPLYGQQFQAESSQVKAPKASSTASRSPA